MAHVTLGDASLATPTGALRPDTPAEPSPRWELLGRCRRDRTVIAGALIVGLIAGAALAAPLVGMLGTGAVGMALVIAGGMVAANLVLVLVARPCRLPVDDARPVVAVAH